VVRRLVRQQLQAASRARLANGLWLWARLGQGGPQLDARWAATWAVHEEKERGRLGKFTPKGFRRKKSFYKLQTNLNSNQI
jgi:hypothetical protein